MEILEIIIGMFAGAAGFLAIVYLMLWLVLKPGRAKAEWRQRHIMPKEDKCGCVRKEQRP
jgi:hypothetical protein